MTVAAAAPLTATLEPAVDLQPSVNGREQEQEQKIAELRAELATVEGERAAAQLVQGGELSTASQMFKDPYLRRWLRARGWDVASACRSILSHAQWRAELAPNGSIPKSEVSNELASGKAFLLGCDTQGRAVVLFQVRKHNAWTRKLDELEKFCCYILDAATAACDPERNPRGHVCVILDLLDMGMGSMDVPAVQALFKLLGEHYVERLGQMIMYQPPMIFWGAWNTLSPLLPAVTLKKILVLAAKDQQTMVEAVGADVLPEEYGGSATAVEPLS